MANATPVRIVVIDVDDAVLRAHVETLSAEGYAMTHVQSGFEGLVAVEELQPAAVLLLWARSFVHWEIIITTLRTGLLNPPPVLVFADADIDHDHIRRTGAHRVLPLSIDAETLLREVHETLTEATP